MILAAQQGRTATVKLLIESKANIDARDYHGDTALMEAAFNGHTETVKLLIGSKANIEAQGNYRYTALMWADLKGYLKIVEYLKQYEVINSNIISVLKTWLFGEDETINMDKYGVYIGEKGHDKFVVNPLYIGVKDGYKLVIGDFNYNREIDYLDLSRFYTITSKDDIEIKAAPTFNGKLACEVIEKQTGKSLVTLIGINAEDLIPENIIIGSIQCNIYDNNEL